MTGMEPFVEPVAGGLVGIVFDVAKKVGGGLAQAVGDRTKAASALKKYADRYTARYGSVRILGMKQDIPLESIYTRVCFLDGLSIRQFSSLEALEQTYRDGRKRRLQTRDPGTLDGFIVANENPYLMVLGGPGAGKSTFLRRIGLEALKGGKGYYKHHCIPVFLELKRFNATEVDIVQAITGELQNFGFPSSQEFTLKALEQGKLLIIFDGLDEVPKTSLNIVIEKIQDFVTCYDQNRYIASCRIAAHRSGWNRFRDIELADFNDSQIQQFIHNWFQSELDQTSKTSERCWATLNNRNNTAAKELAQTPLLLTFLCMVYDQTQGFPANRARLYKKALDILLEEWAAEKRIYREEIYQGLNPELEKVLLSEIAYQGFINDQLFFTQEELVKHIKAFLSDTVDKPKYLDGRAVLDAIAIQQGILVERAEDVFSFSHLTIQEYLTAQYISQDSDFIKEAISDHLLKNRWREVFLLVAGSISNADKLLELIELEAQSHIIDSDQINEILSWINKSSVLSVNKAKSHIRRSLIIMFLLSLTKIDRRFMAESPVGLEVLTNAGDLAISLDYRTSRIVSRIRSLSQLLSAFNEDVRMLRSALRISGKRAEDYEYDLGEIDRQEKLSDEELLELSQTDILSEGISLAVSNIENSSDQIGQISNDLASIIVELELFGENTSQIAQVLKSLRNRLLIAKSRRKDSKTQAIYYAGDAAFVERIRLELLAQLKIDNRLDGFSEQDMVKIANYLYINGMIAKCKVEAVALPDLR
jgi:NACHT domain